MPINDPIKRERVAPGSLAFDSRRRSTVLAGQSSPGGVTTTQQFITNIYGPTFRVNTTVQLAERRLREVMNAMSNAEHRAKHFVGDYARALEWDDYDNDFSWTATPAGASNPMQWRNPVIATVGAEYSGGQWVYKAPNDAGGNWYFYVMWAGIFDIASNIDAIKLFIYRNGGPYRMLDYFNEDFSDHSKLQQCTVSGGTIIPVAPGDVISFSLQIYGAVGTGSLAKNGSYYSYVCGHRVMCTDEHSNTKDIGLTFNATPL